MALRSLVNVGGGISSPNSNAEGWPRPALISSEFSKALCSEYFMCKLEGKNSEKKNANFICKSEGKNYLPVVLVHVTTAPTAHDHTVHEGEVL